MAGSGKRFSWVIVHTLAIIGVITNLLTGLRFAVLTRDEWLVISALLPQGLLHGVHVLGGSALTAAAIGYLIYQALYREEKVIGKRFSKRYHYAITWFGYALILLAIVSGWFMYFDLLDGIPVVTIHYLVALGFIAYLLLHAVSYFIEYGFPALKIIVLPKLAEPKRNAMVLAPSLAVFLGGAQLFSQQASVTLHVKHIEIDQFMSIDGIADEAAWQDAEPLRIMTHGGANFGNGQTEVTVRAIENGMEAYFFIEWEDSSQSLAHLPLVKTEQGWQVTQNGFYHFNEQLHYEDKLAVLLAHDCQLAGAGTAHLGPRPLKDKPSAWHGKGYHYAEDGVVRDLWHWKAVRTNNMYLADDNFIAAPDIERAGVRRYTAGYMQDSKESGAYVMNWKWYKPSIIVPKRLPISPDDLKSYQYTIEHGADDRNWVIPWFGYQAYRPELDTYPVGTVMPSVMYNSNQMEGDRGDVRARGEWKDGKWSLELARKLDSDSDTDLDIEHGICLWVAAFDHAQISHTRHNQGIRLSFESAL